MTTTTAVRAPRLKFLALAALFAAPVVIATLLYSTGWRPQASVNLGELVQPPRPIKNVELATADGHTLAFSELHHKWTMLYFVGDACNAGCEQALTKMRQAHLTQGKDSDRVQRALIVTSPLPKARLAALAQAHGDTLVLTGSRSAMADLTKQFALPASARPATSGRVYVVDPLGNFMMSYTANAEARGMLKDLKRLLKISQIG
jgi:cytochrome oxidase Cu insertion factor (SCO1/SenC/PrrC family)